MQIFCLNFRYIPSHLIQSSSLLHPHSAVSIFAISTSILGNDSVTALSAVLIFLSEYHHKTENVFLLVQTLTSEEKIVARGLDVVSKGHDRIQELVSGTRTSKQPPFLVQNSTLHQQHRSLSSNSSGISTSDWPFNRVVNSHNNSITIEDNEE